MADITTPFIFNSDQELLIARKKSILGFSHSNWEDDDLTEIRSQIRNHYRNLQFGKCYFCKNNLSTTSALNCQVEHIVPKSKHPLFMFISTNLCVICADCNQIKREQETLNSIPDTITRPDSRRQYPRSSGSFKIIHPHFDNYEDHILMIGPYYIDKTSKGHFTIGACNLNRRLSVFGWDRAVLDDAHINDLATQLLNTTDSLARGRIIRRLKSTLLLG